MDGDGGIPVAKAVADKKRRHLMRVDTQGAKGNVDRS